MVTIEIELDEDMRQTLVMAGVYYQVSVEKAAELLLIMGLAEFARLLAAGTEETYHGDGRHETDRN